MDNLPNEYIYGLFEIIRNEVASRGKIDRVYKRIADDIEERI